MEEQAVEEQAVEEQAVEEQAVEEQAVEEQAVEEQTSRPWAEEQTMAEQTMAEQTMAEQTMAEQTVEEQTVEEQAVEEQAVEEQAVATLTPTKRTRLKRVHERGHFDKATVHAILDAGMICHVGYVFDGAPYVTPTLYWREDDRVYWHGSSASRMLRHQAAGASVCLTVSHIDGIVLARSGFHHSVNYRSVMVFGEAREVVEPVAKERHLKIFMDRLFPGRWPETRPINDQEMKATKLVGMAIEEASAKVRTGPPVDDEPDYALPIWAGVLPLGTTTGTPVPCPRLPDGIAEPAYLRAYKPG